MKFDFDPGPKFNPKFVLNFFKIFDRNDITFEVGHVWTMRGPSFANVKDKRVTKERPPGPEGYRRPPPPPTPATTKVRCDWWGSLCGAYLLQPQVKLRQ